MKAYTSGEASPTPGEAAPPGERLRRGIRIASYNVENFYLLLDGPYWRAAYDALTEEEYLAMNPSIYNPNKERRKIGEIAETLLAGDFDLVALCEVGGMETLENFNRLYLDGGYECFLHEENSRRGIYVGMLARRGRFATVRAASVPGSFSRNLLRLELELRPEDGGGRLAAFAVHLKSQLGEGLGIAQRMEEARRLAELVPKTRCVLMGDFNGILIPGQAQFEFEPLMALPFRDVLEELCVSPDERVTHYYFGPKPNFTQLDYIFCSNDIKITAGGTMPGPVPWNAAERRRLPSDHVPLYAVVELTRGR